MATRKKTESSTELDIEGVVYFDRIKAEEAILHNYPGNRRLSKPSINKMTRDMLENRWPLNPQTVSFNTDGYLIDGQHRMLAVIQADTIRKGITIPFLVVRNVANEVFDVQDQGQPRGAGQVLAGHGFVSVNALAAAAKMVMRYETFPDRTWSMQTDFSKAAIVAFVLANQDEAVTLQIDGAPWRAARLNISTMVALQWLVLRHSGQPERWDEFLNGIVVGANLKVGDPRLTLRNRDVARHFDGWGAGQGRLGVYLKTWNGFVQGKSIKLLRFNKENLPMPKVS